MKTLDDFPTLSECVAASMDAEPELLPHLPALFADLEDLGVRAGEVLRVLRAAHIGPHSRVLDLGCGKGAVARALAKHTGARVVGIDGLGAFVDHASERARAQGLDGLCRFEQGDVRSAVRHERGYDLVMMLGLGPLFGDARQTVATLRRCARPGGNILLDDAYVRDGHAARRGWDCDDRTGLVDKLESHGDRVLDELVIDSEADEGWYREVSAKIVLRAAHLADRDPVRGDRILNFALRQQQETKMLGGPLVGALFLLEVAAR